MPEAFLGEGTDPPAVDEAQQQNMDMDGNENENGESEERTDDELNNGAINPERDMRTRHGELTSTIDDLRRQLDETLVDGPHSDGAELQQTIFWCRTIWIVEHCATLTRENSDSCWSHEEIVQQSSKTWQYCFGRRLDGLCLELHQFHVKAWLKGKWKFGATPYNAVRCILYWFAWETRQPPIMPSFAEVSKGNSKDGHKKNLRVWKNAVGRGNHLRRGDG